MSKMKVIVKNPTNRKKAVRANGGLVVIESNKTSKVLEVDWDEATVERYKKAGLELRKGGGSAKKEGEGEGENPQSGQSS